MITSTPRHFFVVGFMAAIFSGLAFTASAVGMSIFLGLLAVAGFMFGAAFVVADCIYITRKP